MRFRTIETSVRLAGVEPPSLSVFSDIPGGVFAQHRHWRGGRLAEVAGELRGLADLRAAYDHRPPTFETDFSFAVAMAEHRVWVLDSNFGRSDGSSLWCGGTIALSRGLIANGNPIEVHILGEHRPDTGHQELLWLSLNGRRSISPRRIEWRTFNAGCRVHDRFAVVDEQLWHFGSTVGGLHLSVNAASHGWDAARSGFEDFYLLLRKCASADLIDIPERRRKALLLEYATVEYRD